MFNTQVKLDLVDRKPARMRANTNFLINLINNGKADGEIEESTIDSTIDTSSIFF